MSQKIPIAWRTASPSVSGMRRSAGTLGPAAAATIRALNMRDRNDRAAKGGSDVEA